MKFTILLASLLLNSAFATEILATGTTRVSVDVPFVRLKTEVACVLRQNSEGEGSATLFFRDSKIITMQKSKGLTSALVKEVCSDSRVGTMTIVRVGEYDRATQVDAEIQRARAYKTMEVVLVNSEKATEAFGKNFKASLLR